MSVEVKHWRSQGNLYDMWVQGAYTFVPEQSTLLEVWDTVMLVALSCTTFLLPIECTLMTELPPWAQQANAILDGIFCVDILMNFNIAYNRSDHLSTAWERSPVKIAGRYTAFPLSQGQEAGWFWLDVATILPYDRLPALFMGSKSARLVRVMRLVRMFRLVRVIKLAGRWQSHTGMSYAVTNLLKCVLMVMVCLHWLACFWASLAMPGGELKHGLSWLHHRAIAMNRQVESLSMLEVYGYALNHVTSTLTGVGGGEVRPRVMSEFRLMTVMMMITSFTWAMVMPATVDIVTNLDVFYRRFSERMDELSRIFTQRRLHGTLQWQVHRYMHEAFNVLRTRHQVSTTKWLSVGLQAEIACQSGMEEVVGKIWYLRDLRDHVLVDVVVRFLPRLFGPGEWISDYASCFVIRMGVCISRSRWHTRDDVLGEDMIMLNPSLREFANPRTLTYLEVVGLSREDIMEMCDTHPDFARTIRRAQVKLAIWRGVVRAARESKIQGSFWHAFRHEFQGNRSAVIWKKGGVSRIGCNQRQQVLKQVRALSSRMEAMDARMDKLSACAKWDEACKEIPYAVTRC